MGIKLIVDSAADMPKAVLEAVTVVPMTVHFGDREYVDGIDLDSQTFYRMLVQETVFPTTSQPTPYAFGETFRKAVENGDEVVCITVSRKLSGTYQSAIIAAEDYPDKVFVVDSENVTLGEGILTAYALERKDQAPSAQALAAELEAIRSKVKVVAMLDTLEYLKKGGRVSGTVALAGGLLNIKPLVTVENGELKLAGKARGTKQAMKELMAFPEKAGGIDPEKPILLGYSGEEDSLMHQYLSETEGLWPVEKPDWACVGSVIGAHAGPGAIAAAFFVK